MTGFEQRLAPLVETHLQQNYILVQTRLDFGTCDPTASEEGAGGKVVDKFRTKAIDEGQYAVIRLADLRDTMAVVMGPSSPAPGSGGRDAGEIVAGGLTTGVRTCILS